MHNVVKKLTSFFDYYLENLFRDISNEFKYCADSLFLMEEVTFHIGKNFRKPVTYNACCWLSVYDVSVEYDGRSDVYRVFFSACEKADIQLKIKACNNELQKLDSKNNQLHKEVNSSKTKEELEKQVSKLEKSEECCHKRRERIMEENNILDSSKVAIEDVENRLMEKFKSGAEQGKERKQNSIKFLIP